MKRAYLTAVGLVVICFTSACTTPRQATMIETGTIKTLALQPVISEQVQPQNSWVYSFGWRCNADGGYYQSYCYDLRDIPDPKSGTLPAGLIHCKTTQQIIKRDSDTLSGWRVGRGDNDVIMFRHVIRANSSMFGPGREIEVVYSHRMIKREDRDTLGPILGCDFAGKGGDELP